MAAPLQFFIDVLLIYGLVATVADSMSGQSSTTRSPDRNKRATSRWAAHLVAHREAPSVNVRAATECSLRAASADITRTDRQDAGLPRTHMLDPTRKCRLALPAVAGVRTFGAPFCTAIGYAISEQIGHFVARVEHKARSPVQARPSARTIST